jgi:hypothetical protein
MDYNFRFRQITHQNKIKPQIYFLPYATLTYAFTEGKKPDVHFSKYCQTRNMLKCSPLSHTTRFHSSNWSSHQRFHQQNVSFCNSHSVCLANTLEFNHNNTNCCQPKINLVNAENHDVLEEQQVFWTWRLLQYSIRYSRSQRILPGHKPIDLRAKI